MLPGSATMFKTNTLNRRSFLGTTAVSIVAVEMSFMGGAFANAGQPKGLQLAPIKQIKRVFSKSAITSIRID